METNKPPYDLDRGAHKMAIAAAKADPRQHFKERSDAASLLREMLAKAGQLASYRVGDPKTAHEMAIAAERGVAIKVVRVEGTLRLLPTNGAAMPSVTLESLGLDFDPISRIFVGPEASAPDGRKFREDALDVLVDAVLAMLQKERST